MDYGEWNDKYQPIKNLITYDSPYEGCMFETYSPDLDFVRNSDLHNIWTIVQREPSEQITSYFVDKDKTLHTFVDNKAHVTISNVETHQIDDLIDELNCQFPDTYIITGFHFVNRLGYLMTSIPWSDEDKDLEILDD